jgi:cellulose synthase/poly-beta-1,6-N-acetylglucosamine synthase-like glycosyltransferase
MSTIFWSALGLVAFSYVGYFLLPSSGTARARRSRRCASSRAARTAAPGASPTRGRRSRSSSAFDEEAIRQKIENCLALDYPPDRLEIVVGCDGCTDRTAEVARAAGGDRVIVHELSPRSGKPAALSKLVPNAKGDIVVLTDANVMLEPGAVRALVRRFRDPAVGAVVGRLRLYNPTRAEFEESLYWKYETALKYYEGKHGAVLGANGGLYAIRRILFSPIRPDTIIDDFVIPVRIAVRGWRVPYEPDAVAHEETTEDAGREFGRRARIGAGDWQALARVPALLDPRTGFVFFSFVAHKLLRWMTPSSSPSRSP